eukprot:m.90352 g.90352  ORF g.90352 m.90352 type:complete len:140 (-) comp15007_c0_seq1:31-450(-)
MSQLRAGHWPKALEAAMFNVLYRCRPVGLHRHAAMLNIYNELRKLISDITPEDIWAHLDTLYDLETLNENEDNPLEEAPFVENPKASFQDFDLPEEWMEEAAPGSGGSKAAVRRREASATPAPSPKATPLTRSDRKRKR